MKDLKIIAIYLPQYHQVEENSKWWGEGFTDWTAVKQAEKYYEEHYQPRVPLNNNYYDLNNKETIKWQANLANKYGIYGFCFYHYYFKDGRKILEKPAENLLRWKDISLNFCFSWASASWQRTWSNFTRAGAWASKFEHYRSDENPILLQQDYGNEEDWNEHFNYLLPFFKDERYIKIDGKPVFLFYLPQDISCITEMVLVWRKLAKKNGFPDLYLIATISNSYQEYPMVDALYIQEPGGFINDFILYSDNRKKDICIRYNDYEDVCRWEAFKKYKQTQKKYYSAFPGYDTSPRHGKRGIIIDNSTPEKFEISFREACRKSIKSDNEFVFINAWNEWGEGNYLEPDEKYGYDYLKAVLRVSKQFNKNIECLQIEKRDIDICYQVIEHKDKEKNKYYIYTNLYNKWMKILDEKREIATFFYKHKYYNIAIYGMGTLGKHLFKQLESKVDIKYFIDRKGGITGYSIPVYSLNDVLPSVDVIIITIVDEYEDILTKLSKKITFRIVSLDEIIDYCLIEKG